MIGPNDEKLVKDGSMKLKFIIICIHIMSVSSILLT